MNPIMIENNPSYLAFLEGLNEKDKAQLLHGCWNVADSSCLYWDRKWVKEITSDMMPPDVVGVRAYDLAATERTQANKFPDPTACCQLFKDRRGYLYLAGNYHPEFYDDYYEIHGQFCKRAGDRDVHILKQAEYDGDKITIILPVDVGAAGKSTYESMAAFLAQEGYRVKPDPMPNNKSKLTRFIPFATASENGLVYVLKDTFDEKTLNFIYKQLEDFTGERSTSHRKDEFPDLLASGTNYLFKAKPTRYYSLPDTSDGATLLAKSKG